MYAAFFQAIQSLRNPLVFIVFVQVPEVRDENGFTFRGETLHDGLLIVGGRLTLFERDRPHRALPDTGAEAITVNVADHDRFTVNQLQGSFVATVDAVSTAVAKGFVYSDNRAFHFSCFLFQAKLWQQTANKCHYCYTRKIILPSHTHRQETAMDYSALTHIPLFGQITPDELEGIFNELNIHENSFKKGEILALQDEPANRLIILLKGSVKAEMTDPSGKVVKVEDIEAPNPLAVLFLFGRDNRFPVQATAREHVEAVVIPKQSILKMLSMNETILKTTSIFRPICLPAEPETALHVIPHDPAEDRHVPAAPR